MPVENEQAEQGQAEAEQEVVDAHAATIDR